MKTSENQDYSSKVDSFSFFNGNCLKHILLLLFRGHVVVCEMWLYDLSKIKLLDMQVQVPGAKY